MSFLLNFGDHELILPTYNFLFFLIYTALVVVFIYNAKVELSQEDKVLGVSIENFVERYRITNREREIIEELLKGKTNQEIADSLFISLQTVKDHTSRIYLKTHLKNRTQLISNLRSNM
jgi:DNA-binding NarL/FixJ family response regulator